MPNDTQQTTARMLPAAEQLCRQCGYLVWGPIWLEAMPPGGECLNQAARVTDCSTAMEKARIGANLHQLGVLPHAW